MKAHPVKIGHLLCLCTHWLCISAPFLSKHEKAHFVLKSVAWKLTQSLEFSLWHHGSQPSNDGTFATILAEYNTFFREYNTWCCPRKQRATHAAHYGRVQNKKTWAEDHSALTTLMGALHNLQSLQSHQEWAKGPVRLQVTEHLNPRKWWECNTTAALVECYLRGRRKTPWKALTGHLCHQKPCGSPLHCANIAGRPEKHKIDVLSRNFRKCTQSNVGIN